MLNKNPIAFIIIAYRVLPFAQKEVLTHLALEYVHWTVFLGVVMDHAEYLQLFTWFTLELVRVIRKMAGQPLKCRLWLGNGLSLCEMFTWTWPELCLHWAMTNETNSKQKEPALCNLHLILFWKKKQRHILYHGASFNVKTFPRMRNICFWKFE